MYHAIVWPLLILVFALLVYVEKRQVQSEHSWWAVAFFTASIVFTIAVVLCVISLIVGMVGLIGLMFLN